ncbi:MAG: response regulator [Limnochordia bacterium]
MRVSPIRVLIADDHALLREGLRRILELEPTLEVVGEASNGEEAIQMAKELSPHVILMDIRMPGMGGLEATRAIREQVPSTDIIALTIHDGDEYVVEMVNAGAKGYVLKNVEPATLVEAIHRVHEGESFIPSDLMVRVFREFQRMSAARKDVPEEPSTQSETQEDRLTARELEVLQHIVLGETNKEIAASLYISEKTVKNHVTNILRKLGLSDRTQAAVYALRHNLVNTEG